MRERLTGIKRIGYSLFMIAFSFLTLSANAQQAQKKIEKLPSFSYFTLDGKKFTEGNLDQNSRLMIVYFNPMCEVCREETEEILTNIDYFKDIQIVMISPNIKDEIMEFSKKYNIPNFNQIVLLHDPDDSFYKQFNAIGYPSLYLYDHEKVLIGHFDSHADIDEIKEVFGPSVASEKK